MKLNYNLKCNLANTLNIVGDKWTLLVLHRIFKGINIYKNLLEALSPIPTNILSNRLKLLEENKLIIAELYSEHPPRYKYVLTEKGEDFRDVFYSMIIWGEKHLDNCDKTVLHEKCGEKVEIKYYCSNCNEYVEDLIVNVYEDKNK
ncbi:winged helix-turn-helix transcriptional regulator [Clostridium cylindrosporum]|uniref:Transcriptional regulator, HxlR family n=1 Tax=Clostridium cylindrosporum DSM 605 TaxID=1121307 RepID=A0A0J8DCW4_CLOCY|nr:helix-turn-helix domain-containing protein [Clostridium cylindrosporum]KMT22099.1 transcriptional regulator, HxlR family [Clostridium cylindrosporum DSM 605]